MQAARDTNKWVSAENTGTAEAYEDYLIRFPEGLSADLAKDRLMSAAKERYESAMHAAHETYEKDLETCFLGCDQVEDALYEAAVKANEALDKSLEKISKLGRR